MATPKGVTARRIVPSKLTPIKPRRSAKKKTKKTGPVVMRGDEPPAPCDCPTCPANADGFWYCYDGNLIFLSDYPKTGGPWIPAIQPNGQIVWLNGGGL